MYLSSSYGPDRKSEIHRLLTNEIRLFKSRNDFASHLEDLFAARCAERTATDQLTGQIFEIPNKSSKFLRNFLKRPKEKALKTTENESWQFLDALCSTYVGTQKGFLSGSILDYFELLPENNASSASGSHPSKLPTGQSFALVDEDRGAVAGVFTLKESILRPGILQGTVWTRKSKQENIDDLLVQSGAYRKPSYSDHYHWQAVGCYIDSKNLPGALNRELDSGLYLIMREFKTLAPGTILLSVNAENGKAGVSATLQAPLASSRFVLEAVEIDKKR